MKKQLKIDGYTFTIRTIWNKQVGALYIQMTYKRQSTNIPVKDILGNRVETTRTSKDLMIINHCMDELIEIAQTKLMARGSNVKDVTAIYNIRREFILSDIRNKVWEYTQKIHLEIWNKYYAH